MRYTRREYQLTDNLHRKDHSITHTVKVIRDTDGYGTKCVDVDVYDGYGNAVFGLEMRKAARLLRNWHYLAHTYPNRYSIHRIS